jgi:hypothetical protein
LTVLVFQLDTAFSPEIAGISMVFLDFTHEQGPAEDMAVTILMTIKAMMIV